MKRLERVLDLMQYLRAELPAVRVRRKRIRSANYRPRGKQVKATLSHADLLKLYETEHCAICGGRDKNRHLAIDHCHDTGLIRGLLCMGCNTALGRFKDDPVLLRKAIVYLERQCVHVEH